MGSKKKLKKKYSGQNGEKNCLLKTLAEKRASWARGTWKGLADPSMDESA